MFTDFAHFFREVVREGGFELHAAGGFGRRCSLRVGIGSKNSKTLELCYESRKCQRLGTHGGNVSSIVLAQNAQILDGLLGRGRVRGADVAHEDELVNEQAVLQALPGPRGITIPNDWIFYHNLLYRSKS